MSNNDEIKLRSFVLEDLDLVLERIDKIGVEEFRDCFKDIKIDKKGKKINVTSIGIDVGFKIAGKIKKKKKKCLDSFYELISKLSEKDIEDVKKMDLFRISKALIEIFQRQDCKDFLSFVSSLKKLDTSK